MRKSSPKIPLDPQTKQLLLDLPHKQREREGEKRRTTIPFPPSSPPKIHPSIKHSLCFKSLSRIYSKQDLFLFVRSLTFIPIPKWPFLAAACLTTVCWTHIKCFCYKCREHSNERGSVCGQWKLGNRTGPLRTGPYLCKCKCSLYSVYECRAGRYVRPYKGSVHCKSQKYIACLCLRKYTSSLSL